MEDLVEINNLREVMATYARFADEKNFSALAELFVPDGTFLSKQVNGETLVSMKGRKEIEEIIAASVGPATAIHHLFSYETKLLSPTEAHSVVAMEDRVYYPKDDSQPKRDFYFMHGFGHYHLDFMKIEDRWFIKSLLQTRIRLEFKN